MQFCNSTSGYNNDISKGILINFFKFLPFRYFGRLILQNVKNDLKQKAALKLSPSYLAFLIPL